MLAQQPVALWKNERTRQMLPRATGQPVDRREHRIQRRALPLIFITAWEGLVDRAAVHADQKVLVQGGAGGVGHFAIQLARAYGAEIFAVDSAAKKAFLTRLGATPIDYREMTVEQYVAHHTDGGGFDIVCDTVGGAALDASFQAIRRFGHVVSCLGWGTHALAPLSFRAATYSGVFTLLPMLTGQGREHHGEILREATRLVETGKIMPQLDHRHFTLETLATAIGRSRPVPLRERSSWMSICSLSPANETVQHDRKCALALRSARLVPIPTTATALIPASAVAPISRLPRDNPVQLQTWIDLLRRMRSSTS
jgi:hypothetical protein